MVPNFSVIFDKNSSCNYKVALHSVGRTATGTQIKDGNQCLRESVGVVMVSKYKRKWEEVQKKKIVKVGAREKERWRGGGHGIGRVMQGKGRRPREGNKREKERIYGSRYGDRMSNWDLSRGCRAEGESN